jgi:hypothetical protein
MFFDLSAQPDKDKQALLAFDLTPKVEAPAPIDPFELVVSTRPYELMTDEEMYAAAGGILIFDVEVYRNYLLISFLDTASGKVIVFEKYGNDPLDRRKLQWVMNNFLLIGYNCKAYDILMIQLAIQGEPTEVLKQVSDQIIIYDARSYDIEKQFGLQGHNFNYIDLINVAPLTGSLKLYGGRLHCKRMQDLPFEHDAFLGPVDIHKLKLYNINDLDNTKIVFEELKPQLELRYELSHKYGVDVRSRSDAQIAEAVIVSELTKITGEKPRYPKVAPGTEYSYKVPKFISYQTTVLQEMLEVVRGARFAVNEASGSVELPEEVKALKIALGSCVYRMGIGGLHSSEKTIAHIADENTLLIDRDVVSYYPAIILNLGLYPKQLGKDFLTVYRSIVQRRIEAKKTGDKVSADSLKIVVNGSFGKLGSMFSALYAPDLMLQVTLTGQLSLLKLIEMIEAAGIPVVSANTDGVLIKCPAARQGDLQAVIQAWEKLTGFETEEGRYKAVYSRDVNNYIAVGDKGKIKTKGTFGNGLGPLWKNPENQIVKEAVIALLTKGTPIENTIRNCSDVRRFLTLRNVSGGAVKSGVLLGRCVRWYFSQDARGIIEYVKSGNKVPNTDGAMPLMEIPDEIPADLDYDRYIKMAESILVDIGHTPPPEKMQRFLF